MERGTILSKLSIIIYCVMVFILNEQTNEAMYILSMLGFICINMLFYLTKKSSLKNAALVVSITLTLIFYFNIDSYFILLLPINIYELTLSLKYKFWIGAAFTAGVWLQADTSLKPVFTLIALMGFFVVYGFSNTQEKLDKLQGQVDELRSKNDELSNTMHRDMEQKSQLKYLTQLEERNKIAQEIHDSLGHTLSGSLMQLEAAKLLMDVDKDKSRDMITNIIQVLRVGMENIRATLRNIKPPSELLGFNKIKFDLDSFSNNSNIKTNLTHSGDLNKVSFTEWKVIQQNIKEALTNTMKYSRASAVTVRIEILNKYLKVEVKDNGFGAYNVNKGLGLRGIEERCENLGGKVIIDGSKGFSVIMLLPVENKRINVGEDLCQ